MTLHAPADDTPRPRIDGRGGARPGAGRKPKTDQNDAYTILAKAKAKRETYNAMLAELEYRQKAGELFNRAEVLQVFTTTVAIFAEQIRTLPDLLERKSGLTPHQAEMAADEIDSQLEELKRRLMGVLADG